MSEKLVNGIIGAFGGMATATLGKEILVFIISLLPILELRGGLLAASLLGLDPIPSYIITIVGNLLPIPFILWFINKILDWMRNSKHLKGVASWLDKKVDKHKSSIEKYGFWGLVLFVGIPLPGTGAWTGTLAASILDMDFKSTTVAVMLGVLLAGVIMMAVSFLGFSLI